MSDEANTTAEETQAPGQPEDTTRRSKQRRGVVVSAKANKTVVVRVERRVKHKRYKKYVTLRKRYAAHDTIGCKEGDIVLITETAPISKMKRWRVSKKLDA